MLIGLSEEYRRAASKRQFSRAVCQASRDGSACSGLLRLFGGIVPDVLAYPGDVSLCTDGGSVVCNDSDTRSDIWSLLSEPCRFKARARCFPPIAVLMWPFRPQHAAFRFVARLTVRRGA